MDKVMAFFKGLAHTTVDYAKEYDMYLDQHFLAIQEVSMWLGWELARIKKIQENSPELVVDKTLLPTSL